MAPQLRRNVPLATYGNYALLPQVAKKVFRPVHLCGWHYFSNFSGKVLHTFFLPELSFCGAIRGDTGNSPPLVAAFQITRPCELVQRLC